MTCREKLKIEYPNMINRYCSGGCYGCPHDYEYLDRPDYCSNVTIGSGRCTVCWDREIPESVDIDDVNIEIDELYSALRFSGFTEEQTNLILKGFHIIIDYLEKKEERDASV
jgi:hypothetical protein